MTRHGSNATRFLGIAQGNGSAGKTSICNRFKDDGFKRVYRLGPL